MAEETITKNALRQFCIGQARQDSLEAEANWQVMQDKSRNLTDEQYEALHIAHSTLIGSQQAYRNVLEFTEANEQRDYGCVCSQGEVANYDE